MGTFKTTTGCGYFKDAKGRIIDKVVYSAGVHPLPDGCTFIEVADQNKLKVIEQYDGAFDASKCKKDLFNAFKGNAQSLQALLAIYAPISDFLGDKNFVGLKEYAQILLGAGAINQGVYNAFKQVLSSNNVDLDAIGG